MYQNILVVGGGPAGLLASINLREKRYCSDITILEEHKYIGKPEHCAGVISIKGLEKYYYKYIDKKEVIFNKVRGARIHFPEGKTIIVEGNKYIAAIVDRERFDYSLYKEARKREIKVRMNEKVKKISSNKYSINILASSKKIYRAHILILATGVNDNLSYRIGFSKNERIVPALQYVLDVSKTIDTENVDIFLGNRYSKDFFAWIIPLSDKKIKVGVASRDNPLIRIKLLLNEKNIKEKIGEYRIKKVLGGAVITSGPKKKLVIKNGSNVSFIIGDTAGMTKPTTGGGVVFIGIATELLSKSIVDKNYYQYQVEWWRKMRNEIVIQKALRKFLDKLNDKELFQIYNILKSGGFEEISANIGEMDYQSKIIKNFVFKNRYTIFRHPWIIAKFISSLINSLF